MINSIMASKFEELIKEAAIKNLNVIRIININNNSEVCLGNKKLTIKKGLLFSETIFEILKVKNEFFNPMLPQYGRVHYHLNNIFKTISYESTSKINNTFEIILRIFPSLEHPKRPL